MTRVHLCVVGRLRAGPERDMIQDYVDRFDKTGRNMGLGPIIITEVDAKGAGQQAEHELLSRALPKGAVCCVLDERGKVMSSPRFAEKLSDWRDQGAQDIAFIIGGADGLLPEMRANANAKLSFGAMVWPHMLARVMLCEQLYRAASILAGSPYHRV